MGGRGSGAFGAGRGNDTAVKQRLFNVKAL